MPTFRPPFQINPNAPSRELRGLTALNETLQGLGEQFSQDKYRRNLLDLQNKKDSREQRQWEMENETPMAPFGPMTRENATMAYPPNPQDYPQGPEPASDMRYGTMGPQPSTAEPMSMSPDPSSQFMTPAPGPGQMPGQGAPGGGGGGLISKFDQWKQGRRGVPQGAPQGSPMGPDAMSWYEQYLRAPGSKGRSEMMTFRKDQREEGLRESEIEKNRAMAEMYRRGGSNPGKGKQVVTDPNTGLQYLIDKGSGETDPINYGGPSPSGAPGAQPPATGRPGPNTLQTRLNPNEYKMYLKDRETFDNDSVIKSTRDSLAKTNNLERMLTNYNPALTGPLASQQARAIANEVGTLNEGDVQRQVPDPSMFGRFRRAVSIAATGQIPADQLQLLKQVVVGMKQASQSRLNQAGMDYARRLSTNVGGKVSPEEFYKNLELQTSFSGGSGGYDTPNAEPDVIAYAQKHGITVEQAADIKRRRTGGQ